MTIVDTHAHIYHADETRYPMIPEAYRPDEGVGTIEHLRKNMRASGIDRVTLVQTGSAYKWDNRLVGDIALSNREDMVGICNLDPMNPASVDELTRLATRYNVKGLRLEPGKDADPLYDNEGSARMFETARNLGVVICAHLHVPLAGELSALLHRYPDVPVVLDHTAYLTGKDLPDSERVRAVVSLAACGNLNTKLTFGITGSEETDYPFHDTHNVIRTVIDAFGPDRCMWGSDFPCEHWLKKATYQEHLNMFTKALGLSAGEQQAILSDTALRVWFGT